jgi:hypothetical protein
MNIFNYLKIAGIAAIAILGFMFGGAREENKSLGEKLKKKEEEEKNVAEIQERVIKRDNISIDTKRERLRKRASKDK